MRYQQFKIRPTGQRTLLPEQVLDEVNMSPGGLESWAKKNSTGMVSGFEAELVFKDALVPKEDPDADMEPDYDRDERADSIDDIIRFFGSEIGSRRRSQLSDEMHTNYQEWASEVEENAFFARARYLIKEYIEEHDWDWQEKIAEYLQDTMGKTQEESEAIMDQGEENDDGSDNEDYVFAQREVEDQFNERVEQAITDRSNNDDWTGAYEIFTGDFDHQDESDWLRSIGIRFMSDASDVVQIDWPHWRRQSNSNVIANGRYDPDIAAVLAKSLESALGVKTQVESGTRGTAAKRSTPADVWVFEADGSLRPGKLQDMPIEIVSPPMDLKQTLDIMPRFFDWAQKNGAYANKSTGLHMSVSVPEHAGDNLDYVKTALFLGDKYVLENFGRIGSEWCESALARIRSNIRSAKSRTIIANPNNIIEKAFAQMRSGLNSMATRAIATPSGFGKYFTINPKENYIEFRSAGNKDYITDVPKLQNTMLRYARAVGIGMDADAEKSEYAKKLYKTLGQVTTRVKMDPKGGRQRTEINQDYSKDSIKVFSDWMAGKGELTNTALKRIVKQIQQSRELEKQIRQGQQMLYKVEYGDSQKFVASAYSPDDAVNQAREHWSDWASDARGFRNSDFRVTALRPTVQGQSPAASSNETTWAVVNINDPSFAVRASGDTEQEAIENALWNPDNDNSVWTRGSTDPADFRAMREPSGSSAQSAPAQDSSASNDLPTWTVWAVSNPSWTVRATGANENDAITDATWNPANQEWAYGHAPEDFRAIRAPNTAASRSNASRPAFAPPGMPPSDPAGEWAIRARNTVDGFGGQGPILYQFRDPDTDEVSNIRHASRTSDEYARLSGTSRDELWVTRTNELPAELRPRAGAIPEVPIDVAQNFQEPPASWDSGTPVTRGEWGGGDPAERPGTDMSTANTSRGGRWYIVNHDTGEVVHEFVLQDARNTRHYAEQQAELWRRVTSFDDPIRVYAHD